MEETLKLILDKLESLENGQRAMQSDITDLKGDVSSLKQDMVHHNHYVEPLLKAVKDGVDGLQERNQQH